jgi:hypothetical protein
MMKNGLRISWGHILGGMKMTKYVHCTVVETRVDGKIMNENPETPEPCPQSKRLRNAYQIRVNGHFHNPATLDFRA